jgi:heme/copper-type cytochrome/quinol oxidase subunit 2
MAPEFVISIIAVVLVLIVLAVLIVTCFRQKESQNTNRSRPEERTRHRRYINRGGRIVLSESRKFCLSTCIIQIIARHHSADKTDKGFIFTNVIISINSE